MGEYIEFAKEEDMAEISTLRGTIRRLEQDLEEMEDRLEAVAVENMALQNALDRCRSQTSDGRELGTPFPRTIYDRMSSRRYGGRRRTKRRKRKGKKSRRRKR